VRFANDNDDDDDDDDGPFLMYLLKRSFRGFAPFLSALFLLLLFLVVVSSDAFEPLLRRALPFGISDKELVFVWCVVLVD
jgi:hypothetical protein